MRYTKEKNLAIILIAIGALILLGKFIPFLGFISGTIMSYLIPVIMIAIGYYGIKRGNALFGYIILIIGVLYLLSKLAWLIGPLLAIGLIIFGISMLRGRGLKRY
ncbi:LiaF transmembrane domain-containing protein [Paenibacillus sp. Marseille-Q7038]